MGFSPLRTIHLQKSILTCTMQLPQSPPVKHESECSDRPINCHAASARGTDAKNLMGFSPNDSRLTKSSNQIEVTGESNPCNGLLEHAFTDRQVREGYSFPLRGLSLSKAKFYSSLFEEGNDIFQHPMDPEIIMAIIFEEARSRANQI